MRKCLKYAVLIITAGMMFASTVLAAVVDPRAGVSSNTAPSAQGVSPMGSSVNGPGAGNVDSTLQLGGASVTMLKGNESGQQLSVVIQTADGKLIVVDGGIDTNRRYLCNFIKQRGGKVDVWLLTHPHIDHVGALTAILERQNDAATPADDYSKIEIGDIYYSFAPVEFYRANEPSYRIPVVEEAYAALAKHDQTKLHYNSPRGTVIQVGDVKITVMNELFLSTVDAGNNSSIVYKIEINGKKLLFLGDLPYEGAQNLMSLWQPSDLKADVVQMAHHGEHGGSPEFYRMVDPEWCLWPTHAALWAKRNDAVDNSTDTYTIAKTMSWIKQMGVKHNYAMCEGDWTLR